MLTLFLLPTMNERLRPQILAMKPGTRVVANYFGIGDWSADAAVHLPQRTGKCGNYCSAYLWIVPADVNGVWQTSRGELVIEQRYQYFKGTLAGAPIAKGVLRGEALSFEANGIGYRCRVHGEGIEGAMGASNERWSARRKAR
ncbi:MAG: hypothetical protein FJY56_20450 [Betaproteobacteria bacterium]|nr:hypothetical protein [Betaproteobacteria bacterium]